MMQRAVAIFLTLLGPVTVLVGSVWGFGQLLDPTTSEGRQKVAGRVLNGRAVPHGVVAVMEATLAEAQPKVIILGNSIANKNIHQRVISKALGLPAKEVVTLTVPGSVGAHWYAILKNRVYANGHQVPLVIIGGSAQTLLLNDPFSEAGNIDLTVQLTEDEPLIEQKVSRSNVWWGVLRAKRGALRESVLDGVRDFSIGLLFEKNRRAINDQAMARVFHQSRVDHAQHTSAMPIVEDQGTGITDPEDYPLPHDSFLPHIADLASAHGTKLVVVRTPMAPRTPPEALDNVPEGTTEAITAMLRDRGHHFVDLTTLPVTDSQYDDFRHTGDEGGRTLSLALARVLRQIAAFGPDDAPTFYRPPPATIEDPGADLPPPVQNPVGDPDGVWVRAGHTLTVRFDEGWSLPAEAFQVHLVSEQFGKRGTPMLRVDGIERTLNIEKGGNGRPRVRAHIRGDPPTGPWSVELTLPVNASPLYVGGLRIGRGPGARQVIGRFQAHVSKLVDLFGEVELDDDGTVSYKQVDATFASRPPPVKAKGPIEHGKKPEVGAFETSLYAQLTDKATASWTPLGVRCSPLQVLQDGVVLPRRNESCDEMLIRPGGKTCHGYERVIYGSTGRAVAVGGVRTYTIRLDPERACWGGRWLYPKDRFTVKVPGPILQRFRDGLRAVRVTAVTANGEAESLRVRVKASGRWVLDTEMAVAGEEPVTRTLGLNRTVWPDAKRLVVEVEGSDQRTMLVTSLALSERAPKKRKKKPDDAADGLGEPPARDE